MEYRPLGRTGVKVSSLCLGALMLGKWGDNDENSAIRLIHRALDAGINIVDTADVYSYGGSEEIVGQALRGGLRDKVVLATKFHQPMSDDPNQRGNSRRWIFQAVENSLRRLKTDWIDLYQSHRPAANTEVDETLGALTDLIRQGKIRYIGSSTFLPSQIVEAQWVAERRGRERFVCEQPPYSMLTRGVEIDVLPTCQRHGMGVITWGPLNGGFLSGAWHADAAVSPSKRAGRHPSRYDLSLPHNRLKMAKVAELAAIAHDAGLTLIEMAIAFVIRHPAVTAAIIGPRTIEHLEAALAGPEVHLTDEVLDRIDAAVPSGTDVYPADGGWPLDLSPAALRRKDPAPQQVPAG